MTEAHFEDEPVTTGVAEVDQVLSAVAALDPADVASHPAVFEQAHEQLRVSWSGRSDRAEASSYAAWRTGCAEMVTALAALRGLAEAADTYSAEAVATHVALWSAVRP